jgi:lysozyme family protein
MTYTPAFEKAVDHVMLYEVGGFWDINHPAVKLGLIDSEAHCRAVGYTHDPVDAGGETKFGVAKRANPTINITALTWAGALEIYYTHYWLAGKCDKLPAGVAVLHFDGCVNFGVEQAGEFLQRSVSVQVDGSIGDITIDAVKMLNQITVCNNVCDQRDAYYKQLVFNKPAQGRFLNGWLRRTAEMREFSTNAANKF